MQSMLKKFTDKRKGSTLTSHNNDIFLAKIVNMYHIRKGKRNTYLVIDSTHTLSKKHCKKVHGNQTITVVKPTSEIKEKKWRRVNPSVVQSQKKSDVWSNTASK